ncbi:52 kDa repressor of the inhibitor of the protein kinase-like [Hydra vulgaris]|uniref:52 kDa repressor of the inhibitor of the protein kinase-like n=1 Tax=Hydra vulgaris TaxID=6087 RepID=UPI001F5F0DF8|nr:52 kDa repressor of the inhibitor of the protein kinase-like [Hydra vulgaris]
MSQTKIKFYFETKHQDNNYSLDNLKSKPMEVSSQPPLSLSNFSKITCCESFSLPSNNYDIGYLVSNYTSYSSIAKTLSNSELQHLVKDVFVPCKTFSFPKNLNGRSFQFMWIEKFPWLTYSKIFDGAFCLPCVLFGCNFPSECSLVERLFCKPFDRWNDASRYFQKHAFGKNNNKSVCRNKGLHVKTAEVLFSLSSIWSSKTESIDITSQKIVQSQVSKNRQLLQPIIETIILCGRLGLSLRGHRDDSEFHPENSESFNHTVENFVELLHFRVKAGDKVLEDHLKYHQQNASYISKTSQNQLIRCYGEVITDTIIGEIKNSNYFSIIADEASDSSNKEQLSLVIRFVDSKFNIREEFISFLHCTNGVTGQGLFDILLKSISDFSLDIMNCRGQSYDGAGAMVGHTKGLSSRILILNEKATFVHCYSHRLNLVICGSCNVQYVKNLLAYVKEVSYFFNLSPTRQQKLEEHIECTVPIAVKKKLKDVCRTRWVEKVNGLDTFQELFIPLASCLEEMSLNANKSFNHSTASSASSLLKLITGFDFIVAMCITRNVFDLTLPITRMLQSKSNDIYDGLNLIRAIKDVVISLRKIVDQHHKMCYEQALKIAQSINVAEAKPRTSFISKNRDNTPSESISDYFKLVITIPLLDHLSVELDTRFDDTTLKCYKALVLVPTKMISVVQCSHDTSWKDSIISFSDFYATDLPNPLALSGELDLWEAFWLNFEGDVPSNISETLKAINFPGFENIKVCLKLLATFPLTSCECERTFSSLWRLKNYMRSTMVQDRLNCLALMNIHLEIVIDINKVIDKFATYNRRLTLK